MKYLLLLCFLPLYLFCDAKVFIYHRFSDSKHQSTNTSTKELKAQFEYFKTNNYDVVPLEKILNKLKNGEEIPSNWVALTIDDAYKSFYENGLNLFKEYAYPFTLFVYIEATNSKYNDFMTWDELREAKKYGNVELHSYSHKSLIKLSNQEIVEDTKKVKKEETKNDIFSAFEKEFGRTLSGMDYEIIKAWLDKGFSEELILGALNEASYNGVTSLRYIDKILFEWNKKGFKTMDDVKNHLKTKDTSTLCETKVLNFDWLDDNE